MATRTSFPTIDRLIVHRHVLRASLSRNWRAIVWTIVTGPWWIWSDIPRLPLPSKNPGLISGSPAEVWVTHGLDRIATRIWAQRVVAIIVRGIGLGFFAGCLWFAFELLGGHPFVQPIWYAGSIVILLCSILVAALARPARADIARMLDRSFQLQERIGTAMGNIGQVPPRERQQVHLVELQIADAANAITMAQDHPAFRLRLPMRELVLTIALALTFAGLALARGSGPGIPETQTNVVPAFVPAAQRFVQPAAQPETSAEQGSLSAAELQEMMQAALEQQLDLQTLATALADHAITSEAAELIRQGHYSAAAEELRTVSTQVDQLSDDERTALAADLEQAASQMSGDDQSLAGATRQAAEGLGDGGDAATAGMRDLANAVEESGQQIDSSRGESKTIQQAPQDTSTSSSSSATTAQNQPSTGQPAGSGEQQSTLSSSSDQSGQAGAPNSTIGSDSEAGNTADTGTASNQPGQSAPSESGAAGIPGETSGSEDDRTSDGADSGSATGDAPQPSDTNQTGATDNSHQGSGAGSASGQLEAQGISESDVGGAAQNDSAGRVPSQPEVSEAEPPSSTDAAGSPQKDHVAIELSRAPEGESVQIGGNSGASSFGSGAGVMVSSGAMSQGEIGENSPDSNHVPAEYRDIVESYFTDKDRAG